MLAGVQSFKNFNTVFRNNLFLIQRGYILVIIFGKENEMLLPTQGTEKKKTITCLHLKFTLIKFNIQAFDVTLTNYS